LGWGRRGVERLKRLREREREIIAKQRQRVNERTRKHQLNPQGDDSRPPPLGGLIFFEGDRCLCLTL
jgi:hypothetical protein